MAYDQHLSAERLQAFLEGDLPNKEQSRVEEHVAECIRCSEALATWRVLFEDLAGLPSHGPLGPHVPMGPQWHLSKGILPSRRQVTSQLSLAMTYGEIQKSWCFPQTEI